MRKKSDQFIDFILIGLLFLLFGCNGISTNKKSIPENFDFEKMELYQEVDLNPNESIIRILKGWIYISWQDESKIDYVIFVPDKKN